MCASILEYSFCFAGPIIAKSLRFSAVNKNLSIVSFSKKASGLRTKAYSLLTLDNPKLLPFAYPRFSPVSIQLKFEYFFSNSFFRIKLFEFSTTIIFTLELIDSKH